MRPKLKFAIFVGAGCGLLLALSVVFCIMSRDESLIVITGLFAVLYVIFMVKLLSTLKKQKKQKPEQTVSSPLAYRRR